MLVQPGFLDWGVWPGADEQGQTPEADGPGCVAGGGAPWMSTNWPGQRRQGAPLVSEGGSVVFACEGDGPQVDARKEGGGDGQGGDVHVEFDPAVQQQDEHAKPCELALQQCVA